MPHRTPIQIRIDSDPAHLCVVRSAVEAAASRFGLPAGDCDRLVLAVDEAMSNIIRHGYGGRSDKPITVAISRIRRAGSAGRAGEAREAGQSGQAGVEVVIEDETGITDPSLVRPRPREPLQPGGLGVSIIQEAVEEFKCEARADGAGLRLTLRKFGPAGVKHADAGRDGA